MEVSRDVGDANGRIKKLLTGAGQRESGEDGGGRNSRRKCCELKPQRIFCRKEKQQRA